MNAPRPTAAATLRGKLPAASLDARAIGRLSKNPQCQRLAALTLAGSSPGKAMEHVFAPGFKEEQSKFAIAKGTRFERIQVEHGGASLIASLQEAGILGPRDVSFRNIEAETAHICSHPARKQRAMALTDESKVEEDNRYLTARKQRAMALTDEILRRKAAGDPTAPVLVYQAALGVPLGSGEVACVRPDILVARSDQPMYGPGEMKSYVYLHHLTDCQDVGQAASQMGVYGMALERRLEHLHLSRPVPTTGALVLVRPGGLQSIAHLQNIERDISAAQRIIDVRPRTLAEVASAIGYGNTLDQPEAIMRLRPCYSGKCRAFCALHDICRSEATANGNPAILGDEAEALFAAAGCNLSRAVELLRGGSPATPEEADLQRKLQTLDAEWRAAS